MSKSESVGEDFDLPPARHLIDEAIRLRNNQSERAREELRRKGFCIVKVCKNKMTNGRRFPNPFLGERREKHPDRRGGYCNRHWNEIGREEQLILNPVRYHPIEQAYNDSYSFWDIQEWCWEHRGEIIFPPCAEMRDKLYRRLFELTKKIEGHSS